MSGGWNSTGTTAGKKGNIEPAGGNSQNSTAIETAGVVNVIL